MTMVVMQPTYLPWLGYFDLIDQSDIFVILDNVQFEKQSWQQRNRIKTATGAQWLTVPVLHSLGQQIRDVRINNTSPWRRKHWLTLSDNYRRSPFWKECAAEIEKVYLSEWDNLSDLNIHLITKLANLLGIEKKMVRASELDLPKEEKVSLLIQLCKHFSADIYLSPDGSRAYLTSDEPFRSEGISLRFHNYAHPTYPQLHNAFVSHLSIIDLLMNVGNSSLAIVRSGRSENKTILE